MVVTARHRQSRKSGHRGPTRRRTYLGYAGGGLMLGDQPVTVSAAAADATCGGLYAEHGPALLRLATALTGGDRGRAEDLVQETMLRAWTHRAELGIQQRSPRALLGTGG